MLSLELTSRFKKYSPEDVQEPNSFRETAKTGSILKVYGRLVAL
jgi:hypothetical protein